MPKIVLNQFSFNRGELDPTLQARSDLEWYDMGARRVNNLILRPGGGGVKRPGFRFVDYAYSDDADKPSRLVKFVFSVQQAYMLEFSHQVIRVIMDGALVLYPPGHPKENQPVEIATGYTAEQIDELDVRLHTVDCCQTTDVMYIVHRRHPPARLVRFKDDQYEYDHHNWRLESISWGAKIAAPAGLGLTKRGNNGAQYVVTAVNEDGEESIVSNATKKEDNTATGVPLPIPEDLDSLNILDCRQWWVYTYDQEWPTEWNIWAWSYSSQFEYFLRYSLGYTNFRLSYGKPGETPTVFPKRPNGVESSGFKENNIGGWYNETVYGINMGWGGILQAMRDRIREYAEKHNENATVTGFSSLAWTAVLGEGQDEEDPAEEDLSKPAIGYRIYRSSDGASWRLIGTADGVDNTRFDDDNLPYDSSGSAPPVANLPFEGEGNYPAVSRFFEQRLLLGRTDNRPNTFWGSKTNNYHNFDRSSVNPTADQSYMWTLDSSEMNEIAFLDSVGDLLIGTAGGEFRAGTNGSAISANNPPNIRPQSDYGVAKVRPVIAGRGLLFVTRSRRAIRDLSYALASDGYQGPDITLWAKHLFRSDRRIVDMTFQKEPDSLLWVVMSDGSLYSCVYMPDQQVMGWSRYTTDGRVESCATVIRNDGTEDLYVTVVRHINGRERRFIECLADTFEDVYDPDRPETVAEGFFVDSGLTYKGPPEDTLMGLDHLDGKEVACFADGNVIPGLVVLNGSVVLPVKASIIHIGLPYGWELETLDLDIADPSQTVRARKCQVTKAWVRVYQGRELWYAADSESKPHEDKFRTEPPGVPIAPFTGDRLISMPASKSGESSSSLYLSGKDPVPAGVLAVIAEVAISEQ